MRIKLKVFGRQTVVRHNPAAMRVDGGRRYYFLGKGEDCFLSCDAADVRPRHCAIVVEGDEAVIYPVDPDGLVAIGGQRVRDRRRLQLGDVLQIGSVRFEVLISAEAVDAMRAPIVAPAAPAEEPSGDVQIGQWLDSVDSMERARLQANPELRRFQLEPQVARVSAEREAAERDDTRDAARDDSAEVRKANEKKAPGKLPARPSAAATRSDEAAASTLTRAYGKSIQNVVRKPRD